MTHPESVHVAVGDDGIAVLTLSRPEVKNAIDTPMAEALARALEDLGRDDRVRVLVLTGAGGDFCAGGDVKAMARTGDGGPPTPEALRAGMDRYARIARAMAAIEHPIVCVADGVCYGAGFSLLLLADIVLLGTGARLCMVFHRMGLVPDVGAFYTLPRVVGLQRAKELVLTAREIDAAEAANLGIALEVVPSDRLMDRGRAIAATLAVGPPVAAALSKRALQASLGSDLATMLEMEANAQAIAATSEFTADAMRRFAAKEPSRFRWPPLER